MGKALKSIFDSDFEWEGEEVDISAEMEEENCRYERENKDSITITALKEPERPPLSEKEQADQEISRARIAFVLGYCTEQEWIDTIKKWGREVPKD